MWRLAVREDYSERRSILLLCQRHYSAWDKDYVVLQMREAEKNKGKRKGRVNDDHSHQHASSGRANGNPSSKKKRH